MPSASELQLAIANYQALIANFEITRDRILDRRRLALEGMTAELDHRLAANGRTIDALRRAVQMSRDYLGIIASDLNPTIFTSAGSLPRERYGDQTSPYDSQLNAQPAHPLELQGGVSSP